jgi:predicted Fe-Mo cluster-binding NifX family protein
MKIAVAHWQGRISPVFDVSSRLCIIHIEGQREVSRENIALKIHDPFGRAKELAELGTNVLLCGAISHVLEKAILAAGVQVIGFLCGDVDAVIPAFLLGLKDGRFSMPGWCGQRQRHRFRGFRGKQ